MVLGVLSRLDAAKLPSKSDLFGGTPGTRPGLVLMAASSVWRIKVPVGGTPRHEAVRAHLIML